MTFRIKVYKQGKEVLVAAADPTLIGKTFKEGKLQITVSEKFYGTEEGDEGTLVSQLRLCTIANLVGIGVVDVAIRHGFVHPSNVLFIEDVPHAQIAAL